MSRQILDVPHVSSLEQHLAFGGRAEKRPRTLPPAGSSVLSRVRDFLPELQRANENLQLSDKAQGFEITSQEDEEQTKEHGDGGAYVQMDLACGLFELRRPDAEALAAALLEDQQVVMMQGASLGDSDSDDSGSASDVDAADGSSGSAQDLAAFADSTLAAAGSLSPSVGIGAVLAQGGESCDSPPWRDACEVGPLHALQRTRSVDADAAGVAKGRQQSPVPRRPGSGVRQGSPGPRHASRLQQRDSEHSSGTRRRVLVQEL